MKESVIDVLMYIFSSYIDNEDILPENRTSIDADLREAGFDSKEIDKAFDWLDGLALAGDIPKISQSPAAMRIFSQREMMKLDTTIQGFLHFLEASGVLTPELRELVINRIMALDTQTIDMDEFKWVVMMVLFNNSEDQDETTLMHYEDIVFADQSAVFH